MFRPNKRQTTRENAEQLAIQALAFIAEDEDRLNTFLMQSGLLPENMREAAQNPDFLEAVMDFMTTGDDMILQFSASAQCTPEEILGATQALRRISDF